MIDALLAASHATGDFGAQKSDEARCAAREFTTFCKAGRTHAFSFDMVVVRRRREVMLSLYALLIH